MVVVTPPEGWEEGEATPFLFEYNKGMSAIWVQEMEEQFDIDDPDGYIETMINSYAGAYPGAEFSSVESLKVAGCDSRKFSYTTTSGLVIRAAIYVCGCLYFPGRRPLQG